MLARFNPDSGEMFMSRTLQRAAIRITLLFITMLLAASASWAQISGGSPVILPIEFKPGEKITVVEGAVSRGGSRDGIYFPGERRFTMKVTRARQFYTV